MPGADPGEALGEAAGGLIARAAQVYGEARRLIADALEAAQALTDGGDQEPPAAFTPRNAWVGRRNRVPG